MSLPNWVPKVFQKESLANSEKSGLLNDVQGVADTIKGLGLKVMLSDKPKALSLQALQGAHAALRQTSEAFSACKDEVEAYRKDYFKVNVIPMISKIFVHAQESGAAQFITDPYQEAGPHVQPMTLHVFPNTTQVELSNLFGSKLVAVMHARRSDATMH